MTEGLQNRLNAKLAELRAAGRVILRISASADSIERLFVEGGDGAILLDCDPQRDTAWYGDVELQVSDVPGAWVIVAGEGGPQQIAV
ncbi:MULTISPECIES: hypothetical protein [Phenylobacterium]|uniref:Deoxyribodipyrimidine photolyase-like uncharacterized protein n=1 Tax=Phenylobacterium koreense TaxID=266125 RepID=A0ABV2EL01_9CAUL